MTSTRKAVGEAANTNVMKLVKTDAELVAEFRAYVDAMIAQASVLRSRNLVTSISFDNGEVSGKVELAYFKVVKIVDEYKSPAVQAAQKQQQGAR